MPPWMNRLESFTPVKALGIGALLSAVNPKNLGLTLAAGASIAQAGHDDGDMWLTLIVFIVIASLTIALPVLYYLMAGASAERTLDSMRLWLVANNTTVMVTLFVIFGFVLLGKGLSGLD